MAETGFIYHGECGHCGQSIALKFPTLSQDEANAQAMEMCDCEGSKAERQIKTGKERVAKLFGTESAELGFEPVGSDETLGVLHTAVENVVRHNLISAIFNLRGYGRAKISLNSKGKIKVERQEVHAYQLEE